MCVKYLVIIILMCVSVTVADKSGFTTSLDMAIIEQAKTMYLSYLVKQINGMPVKNYGIPNGFINTNKLYVKQKADNVDFRTDSDSTAIELSVTRLSTWFRSNSFKYTLWFVPFSGYLDADMNEVNVTIKVQITNQTYEGRSLPAIKVISHKVSISGQQLAFKMGGSILASIADIILPLFQGIIKRTVQESIEGALSNNFAVIINNKIKEQNGMFSVAAVYPTSYYRNLTVDFAFENTPQIVDNRVQVALNGTMFTLDKGYYVPPIAQVDMPYFNPNCSSQFQLFTSDYFLQSASYAFFELASIAYLARHEKMPPNLVFQFNTSVFDAVLPFLANYYGKNVPVDVNFVVRNLTDFRTNGTNRLTSAKLHLDGEIYIRYDNGTFVKAGTLIAEETDVQFEIVTIGNTMVTIAIRSINIVRMYIEADYLGPNRYSSSPFMTNFALSMGMKYFNSFFENLIRVAIPPKLFNLFKLTDLKVNYFDGYLQIGLTPTFLPLNIT